MTGQSAPKKVRLLAIRLRKICDGEGVVLMPDDALSFIQDFITKTARQLGITERTVIDRYVGDQVLKDLAMVIGVANAEVMEAIETADAFTMSRPGSARVVAAMGMCLKLAVEAASAADARSSGALGVATDVADAVTRLGGEIAGTDTTDEVTLSGSTVVYCRRVLTSTIRNLSSGAWSCFCDDSSQAGHQCRLSLSLSADLATIGGWSEGHE